MEYTINVIAERSVVRESLKGILWTIFFHRLFGPITPTMNEFLDVPYPMAANMTDLDTLIDEKINTLIKKVFQQSSQSQLSQQQQSGIGPVTGSHPSSVSLSTTSTTTTNITTHSHSHNLGGLGTVGPPAGSSGIGGGYEPPSVSNGIKTGQVIVQFYDVTKKSKKKTGWFGQAKSEDEEQKLWESWIVNVKCIPIDEKSHHGNTVEGSGNDTASTGTNTTATGSSANNDSTGTGIIGGSSPRGAIELSIASFEENLEAILDIADSHKDHIPPITSLDSSPFPYSIEVGDRISRGVSYSTTEDESWGKYIKRMLD